MPGPKLACVAPCTKLVYEPATTTESDCPTCPEFGVTEEILPAGLTVKEEVFTLAKAVPSAVLPAMEMLYGAGDVTAIDAGIVKLTRRVLPTTVVTAEAAVVARGGPAFAGVKITDTFAGRMVPFGNPEPVSVTIVTAD
jgi:hypothetical protein